MDYFFVPIFFNYARPPRAEIGWENCLFLKMTMSRLSELFLCPLSGNMPESLMNNKSNIDYLQCLIANVKHHDDLNILTMMQIYYLYNG